LWRALLLVTSGSVFWMVAVGPEKTAIRGLPFVTAMESLNQMMQRGFEIRSTIIRRLC
jgi:hypothetical protein